ncbi:MAG: hypothetical protein JNK48_18400 [Bryobacterales bacterium]|nr:hypothetical protein [Bryobacterales bacterium]
MFERYVEKARRIIFFARYEASAFGSPKIESEHLLLGLLREDKPLAVRLLKSDAALGSIRASIEAHAVPRAPIGTSVDLPLSHECKRILAYASEEAERLKHRFIGPPHLVLGILREKKSLAASLLIERDVTYEAARDCALESSSDAVQASSPVFSPPAALLAALAKREQAGDITVAVESSVAGHPTPVAVYLGRDVITPGARLSSTPSPDPVSPIGIVATLHRQIIAARKYMESAVAGHDFAAARQHSDRERSLRDELLRAERNLTPDQAAALYEPVPFLCILTIREESLFHLRVRIEDYFRAGVANIWLIDPARRIYTATPAEGLREFLGDTLRIPQPLIELPRSEIF